MARASAIKTRDRKLRATTLVELLIAAVLVSVIVLGLLGIDTFSRIHLSGAERRARLQNELSMILGHMHKNIAKAVGDPNNPPMVTTYFKQDLTFCACKEGRLIFYWEDGEPDGKLVASNASDCLIQHKSAEHDYQNAYLWCRVSLGGNGFVNSLHFLSGRNCLVSSQNIPRLCNGGYEDLSLKITNLNAVADPKGKYLDVTITGCFQPELDKDPYDPNSGTTCGTPGNPSLTMTERIYLPQVSSN
jgi:hypothetical protein